MPSPPARSLNDKVFSLESKLEREQQELKAGQAPPPLPLGLMWWEGMEDPQLAPCIVPTALLCVPGHSEMLLGVQQLVKGLNTLHCQLAALKSNGEWCVGQRLAPYPAHVSLGSISEPPHSHLRLSKYLLPHWLAGV